MKVLSTPLAGLHLVETSAVRDWRGQFSRVFCESELECMRHGLHFSQINVSNTSQAGTVRGMHFQYPPSAEAKLIRCLRGKVYDVAVDLRADSPTFLSWHAVELCESGQIEVFIPEGFAHGFQSLTDDVQLLYMHTAPWSGPHEGRIRFDDPRLAIDWPIRPGQSSEADRSAPLLDETFRGIRL